jgi:ppGpp synthetase/RelA/SpoT-type nucleotidyltranferase
MNRAAFDNIRVVLLNYQEPETQQLYKKLVESTCQQCEEMLKGKEIKGMVRGRIKKYTSLHEKLKIILKDPKVNPNFEASVSSVYKDPDMGDLAGVRIGLYFPDDILKVAKEIEKHFDIKYVFGTVRGGRDATTDRNKDIQKHMNGTWSSRGPEGTIQYWEHYGYKSWQVVVEWKGPQREELESEMAEAGLWPHPLQPPLRVEIQVGTVVTQAWAEVQHNIIYKNPEDLLATPSMIRIIDAVNGLAITTEIMLKELEQRLEQAKKERAMRLKGKLFWSAP